MIKMMVHKYMSVIRLVSIHLAIWGFIVHTHTHTDTHTHTHASKA